MKQSFSRVALMLMSAMALAFSACSSDDTPKAEEVTPDGSTVKAQLAINVGSAASNSRQSADIIQASGQKFRGMENIYLIPVTSAYTTSTGTDAISFADVIGLTSIDANDYTNPNSVTADEDSHKVYRDLAIPLGTQNFLFYGTAIGNAVTTGNNLSAVELHKTGALVSAGTDIARANSSSEVSYKLLNISLSTSGTTAKGNLLSVLNAAVGAFPEPMTENSDIDVIYKSFTSQVTGSLGKAGSGAAVLKRLQLLYDAVNSLPEDADGSTIKSKFMSSTGDLGFFYTTPFTTYFTLTSNVISYANASSAEATFPTADGLPEGVAYLSFDASNKIFSYPTENQYDYTIGSGDNQISLKTINYPAALGYYAATPLKATSSTETTWPTTPSKWIEANGTSGVWGDWQTTVSASTRTIALVNNINYNVAQLGVVLKKTNSSLLANPYNSESTTSVSVPVNATSIQLNGIIIGGQPSATTYNFLPVSGDNFSQVIYDNQLGTSYLSSSNDVTLAAKTLVLDTYKNDITTNGQVVNFALEFINNTGVDFKGVDGMVYDGQKFYLVGSMKVAATNGTNGNVADDSTIAWKSLNLDENATGYFPAYEKNRVFVQDFTTTANVTIGSLKNAYVTLPDLRANILELGLSVDLQWKAGLSFDVTIQ